MLLDHDRKQRLCHAEHPDQVDIHDVLKLFDGRFERLFPVVDAGIVDEDIQTAQLADGFLHFFRCERITDIARHSEAPAPHGFYFHLQRFERIHASGIDDQVSAFGSELLRDGPAQALACSGNQRTLPLERAHQRLCAAVGLYRPARSRFLPSTSSSLKRTYLTPRRVKAA